MNTQNGMRRVILQNCCETYILDYGRILRTGEPFRCPCCTTTWLKNPSLGPTATFGSLTFQRESDSEVFTLGPGIAPKQLTPISPHTYLLTKRCCIELILKYGLGFRGVTPCPYCNATWQLFSHHAPSRVWPQLIAKVRKDDNVDGRLFVRDQRQLYSLRVTSLGFDLWFETDEGIAEIMEVDKCKDTVLSVDVSA